MYPLHAPKNLPSSCQNCGAPVVFQGSFRTECQYCKTVNTLDLETFHKSLNNNLTPPSFHCPRCAANSWLSLEIKGKNSFTLFRCNDCHGLFIDHLKLKAMVDSLKAEASEEDKITLQLLAEDQPFKEQGIQYLNCPECQQLMARRNYGNSSGVIVDICPDHGTWLDGGELSKIFTWVRAGGVERQKRLADADAVRKAQHIQQMKTQDLNARPQPSYFGERHSHNDRSGDILHSLFRIIEWVIK